MRSGSGDAITLAGDKDLSWVGAFMGDLVAAKRAWPRPVKDAFWLGWQCYRSAALPYCWRGGELSSRASIHPLLMETLMP